MTEQPKDLYTVTAAKLGMEPCVVLFYKKNADLRVMLGTRNRIVMSLRHEDHANYLDAHDKRCNRENGNIGVYDLILGEARSFSIKRMVDVVPLGYVDKREELDGIVKKYLEFKDAYEEKIRSGLLIELENAENAGNLESSELVEVVNGDNTGLSCNMDDTWIAGVDNLHTQQ